MAALSFLLWEFSVEMILQKNHRYQKSGISPSFSVLGTCFEEFPSKFLWMIAQKFSRNSPELVPNYRDLLGFIVLRLSFEKFLSKLNENPLEDR